MTQGSTHTLCAGPVEVPLGRIALGGHARGSIPRVLPRCADLSVVSENIPA
jgi:hypothetical protein